jgi:pyrroline-5-carboxylate reductase
MQPLLAFVGGGNMASAIIGGLVASGTDARSIVVVEPFEGQRERLAREYGVAAIANADAALARAGLVVWAVKPQAFKQASLPCRPHVRAALHLSVMAGIRSDAIAAVMGTERIVRAMPNTPALIGKGIAGLYARAGASVDDRAWVERVLAPTGATLWVERESDLDAVTALSGSGPAYLFYVVEAMMQAAVEMGLSAEQGRTLALATFAGASELALRSADPPALLRERVTSKGGTTFAALEALEAAGVGAAFVEAIRAAQRRAGELGDEFG